MNIQKILDTTKNELDKYKLAITIALALTFSSCQESIDLSGGRVLKPSTYMYNGTYRTDIELNDTIYVVKTLYPIVSIADSSYIDTVFLDEKIKEYSVVLTKKKK